MATGGLRKPDPLSFEGNLAENWRKFEEDFVIFIEAGHSEKSSKQKAYMLLNLAGTDAIERSKTFSYLPEIKVEGRVTQEGESKEDWKCLIKKFKEMCNAHKNVIMERHIFNSRNQKDGEDIQAYIADLKCKADTCEYGDIKDELVTTTDEHSLRNPQRFST